MEIHLIRLKETHVMKKLIAIPGAALLALAAACSGDEAADRGPVVLEPGSYLAVVTTDYSVTAVSVIDRDTGDLVNENVFDSSSSDPGVSLPLSGDVVLPNDKPMDGTLLLVDRGTSNNSITLLETTNVTVLGQIQTGPSASGPWAANPHDALLVDGARLYVTRFQQNPSPSGASSDFDEGDDVVIFNLATQEIAEQFRFNTLVDGGSRAAPDRLALAGDYVAVTLQHYEGSGFTGADDALIAFIDPATEQLVDTDSSTGGIQLLRIEDYKNCSNMSYLESNNTLYAVCSGLFADLREDQTEASAIVAVDMDTVASGDAEYEIVLEGSHEDIGQPLSGLVIVDESLGFVLTYGSFAPFENDFLIAFDPSAGDGDPDPVFESSGPFQLSSMSYDEGTGTLYVSDAPFGGPYAVRRFAADTDMDELDPVDPSPEGGLGPTALGQFEVE